MANDNQHRISQKQLVDLSVFLPHHTLPLLGNVALAASVIPDVMEEAYAY
jgi:hypothetical protein